jgi:hypothetical protein
MALKRGIEKAVKAVSEALLKSAMENRDQGADRGHRVHLRDRYPHPQSRCRDNANGTPRPASPLTMTQPPGGGVN